MIEPVIRSEHGSQIIFIILRFFFNLLYNQFAWAYDSVAWIVSLGNWKSWVRVASRYVSGKKILELGHGPGHLQVDLAKKNYQVFGIDPSKQMNRIASRRLKVSNLPIRLIRCRAQNLAFANHIFDCVVTTFPSEYIIEERTLNEIDRVLIPGGSLVVLPYAWVTGDSLLDKAIATLYRIARQAPGDLHSPNQYRMNFHIEFLLNKGYVINHEYISHPRSQLFLIKAIKNIPNS